MKLALTTKLFTLSVTLCAFTAQASLAALAEANIWKERRQSKKNITLASLPSNVSPTSAQQLLRKLPGVQKTLSSTYISKPLTKTKTSRISSDLETMAKAVPHNAGTVQEIHDAGKKGPRVVLVQDIHLNPEAQQNISAILESVLSSAQFDRVGIEGAFVPFNFKPFQSFNRHPEVEKVATSFLKAELLAAPSFLGITSEKALPPFIGIDSPTHYEANVDAYLKSKERRESVKEGLRTLGSTLSERKRTTLNKDLQKIEYLVTTHNKGQLDLGAYLQKMSAWLKPNQRPPSIRHFLEAYELETSLNFTLVNQQRRNVIEKLSRSLNKDELSILLTQSLAYRMGQMSFGTYYRGLQKICRENGIELKKYPAFNNYVRYVILSDGINATTLFSEMEELEKKVYAKNIRSNEEKNLIEQSHQLRLTEKLIKFELTPREWDHYKDLKNASSIRMDLSSFETFYREADIRSEKMIENLFLPENGREPQNVALVTGGFHSNHMVALLKKKGASVIVVSPKLTKIDGISSTAYLSVFEQEKTPLDQLFTGKKLFVSPFQVHATHTPLLLRLVASMWYGITGRRLFSIDANGTKHAIELDPGETPAQNTIRVQGSLTLASFFSEWSEQKWGKRSWQYWIANALGANIEIVFQLLIPATLLLTSAWSIIIPVFILSAVAFAYFHPGVRGTNPFTNQKFWYLFTVGLALGAPFLFPASSILWPILINVGLHTGHNLLVLTLDRFGALPSWMHLASSRKEPSERPEEGPFPDSDSLKQRVLYGYQVSDIFRAVHTESVYELSDKSKKISDFFKAVALSDRPLDLLKRDWLPLFLDLLGREGQSVRDDLAESFQYLSQILQQHPPSIEDFETYFFPIFDTMIGSQNKELRRAAVRDFDIWYPLVEKSSLANEKKTEIVTIYDEAYQFWQYHEEETAWSVRMLRANRNNPIRTFFIRLLLFLGAFIFHKDIDGAVNIRNAWSRSKSDYSMTYITQRLLNEDPTGRTFERRVIPTIVNAITSHNLYEESTYQTYETIFRTAIDIDPEGGLATRLLVPLLTAARDMDSEVKIHRVMAVDAVDRFYLFIRNFPDEHRTQLLALRNEMAQWLEDRKPEDPEALEWDEDEYGRLLPYRRVREPLTLPEDTIVRDLLINDQMNTSNVSATDDDVIDTLEGAQPGGADVTLVPMQALKILNEIIVMNQDENFNRDRIEQSWHQVIRLLEIMRRNQSITIVFELNFIRRLSDAVLSNPLTESRALQESAEIYFDSSEINPDLQALSPSDILTLINMDLLLNQPESSFTNGDTTFAENLIKTAQSDAAKNNLIDLLLRSLEESLSSMNFRDLENYFAWNNKFEISIKNLLSLIPPDDEGALLALRRRIQPLIRAALPSFMKSFNKFQIESTAYAHSLIFLHEIMTWLEPADLAQMDSIIANLITFSGISQSSTELRKEVLIQYSIELVDAIVDAILDEDRENEPANIIQIHKEGIISLLLIGPYYSTQDGSPIRIVFDRLRKITPNDANRIILRLLAEFLGGDTIASQLDEFSSERDIRDIFRTHADGLKQRWIESERVERLFFYSQLASQIYFDESDSSTQDLFQILRPAEAFLTSELQGQDNFEERAIRKLVELNVISDPVSSVVLDWGAPIGYRNALGLTLMEDGRHSMFIDMLQPLERKFGMEALEGHDINSTLFEFKVALLNLNLNIFPSQLNEWAVALVNSSSGFTLDQINRKLQAIVHITRHLQGASEDTKLTILSHLFSHNYDFDRLEAIFDFYFNPDFTKEHRTSTIKKSNLQQIGGYQLKSSGKRNPRAFFESMGKKYLTYHQDSDRKLDFNYLISFLTTFTEKDSTILAPEAEIFFKLFTSGQLHQRIVLNERAINLLNNLSENPTKSSIQLARRMFTLIDFEYDIEGMRVKDLNKADPKAEEDRRYRSFQIALHLFDYLELAIDIKTKLISDLDIFQKDSALIWLRRFEKRLDRLIRAYQDGKRIKDAKPLFEKLKHSLNQFKIFYTEQKLSVLYSLLSQAVKETDEERKRNISLLLDYSERVPVNEDGYTVFDSLLSLAQTNLGNLTVYASIHEMLMAEAKGEFQQHRYASPDYVAMMAFWEKAYEGLSKLNKSADEVRAIWERNLYYETSGPGNQTYSVGFTDNFPTLLNIGNPSGFGSCQACYKSGYNRGLTGTMLNGWNKVIAIYDDRGRMVARRIIRLRISDSGQLVLLQERSYGDPNGIFNDTFNRLLSKIAFDMQIPYETESGTITRANMKLWRGHSPLEYSDKYGRSAPGPAGIVDLTQNNQVQIFLSVSLKRRDTEPESVLATMTPISEEKYSVLAGRMSSSDGSDSDGDRPVVSIPMGLFMSNQGSLFYEGHVVTRLSSEDVANGPYVPHNNVDDPSYGRLYRNTETDTLHIVPPKLMVASLLDDRLPEEWDKNSWQYRVYNGLLVNWENLPFITLSWLMVLLGSNIYSAVFLLLLGSFTFSYLHPNVRWKKFWTLQKFWYLLGIGGLIGIWFVIPSLSIWTSLIISASIHSVNNILVMVLDRYDLLPKWMYMASVRQPLSPEFEQDVPKRTAYGFYRSQAARRLRSGNESEFMDEMNNLSGYIEAAAQLDPQLSLLTTDWLPVLNDLITRPDLHTYTQLRGALHVLGRIVSTEEITNDVFMAQFIPFYQRTFNSPNPQVRLAAMESFELWYSRLQQVADSAGTQENLLNEYDRVWNADGPYRNQEIKLPPTGNSLRLRIYRFFLGIYILLRKKKVLAPYQKFNTKSWQQRNNANRSDSNSLLLRRDPSGELFRKFAYPKYLDEIQKFGLDFTIGQELNVAIEQMFMIDPTGRMATDLILPLLEAGLDDDNLVSLTEVINLVDGRLTRILIMDAEMQDRWLKARRLAKFAKDPFPAAPFLEMEIKSVSLIYRDALIDRPTLTSAPLAMKIESDSTSVTLLQSDKESVTLHYLEDQQPSPSQLDSKVQLAVEYLNDFSLIQGRSESDERRRGQHWLDVAQLLAQIKNDISANHRIFDVLAIRLTQALAQKGDLDVLFIEMAFDAYFDNGTSSKTRMAIPGNPGPKVLLMYLITDFLLRAHDKAQPRPSSGPYLELTTYSDWMRTSKNSPSYGKMKKSLEDLANPISNVVQALNGYLTWYPRIQDKERGYFFSMVTKTLIVMTRDGQAYVQMGLENELLDLRSSHQAEVLVEVKLRNLLMELNSLLTEPTNQKGRLMAVINAPATDSLHGNTSRWLLETDSWIVLRRGLDTAFSLLTDKDETTQDSLTALAGKVAELRTRLDRIGRMKDYGKSQLLEEIGKLIKRLEEYKKDWPERKQQAYDKTLGILNEATELLREETFDPLATLPSLRERLVRFEQSLIQEKIPAPLLTQFLVFLKTRENKLDDELEARIVNLMDYLRKELFSHILGHTIDIMVATPEDQTTSEAGPISSIQDDYNQIMDLLKEFRVQLQNSRRKQELVESISDVTQELRYIERGQINRFLSLRLARLENLIPRRIARILNIASEEVSDDIEFTRKEVQAAMYLARMPQYRTPDHPVLLVFQAYFLTLFKTEDRAEASLAARRKAADVYFASGKGADISVQEEGKVKKFQWFMDQRHGSTLTMIPPMEGTGNRISMLESPIDQLHLSWGHPGGCMDCVSGTHPEFAAAYTQHPLMLTVEVRGVTDSVNNPSLVRLNLYFDPKSGIVTLSNRLRNTLYSSEIKLILRFLQQYVDHLQEKADANGVDLRIRGFIPRKLWNLGREDTLGFERLPEDAPIDNLEVKGGLLPLHADLIDIQNVSFIVKDVTLDPMDGWVYEKKVTEKDKVKKKKSEPISMLADPTSLDRAYPNETSLETSASILENWSRNKWGKNSWQYWSINGLLANIEIVFQLIIPGLLAFFGSQLTLSLPILLLSAFLFSYAHPGVRGTQIWTNKKFWYLFGFGSILGAWFIFPFSALWIPVVIASTIHTLHNFAVMTLDRFGILPQWMYLASLSAQERKLRKVAVRLLENSEDRWETELDQPTVIMTGTAELTVSIKREAEKESIVFQGKESANEISVRLDTWITFEKNKRFRVTRKGSKYFLLIEHLNPKTRTDITYLRGEDEVIHLRGKSKNKAFVGVRFEDHATVSPGGFTTILYVDEHKGKVRARIVDIKDVNNPMILSEHELHKTKPLLLGRGQDATLRIDNIAVSKEHALVYGYVGDSYIVVMVRDDASSNGTQVYVDTPLQIESEPEPEPIPPKVAPRKEAAPVKEYPVGLPAPVKKAAKAPSDIQDGDDIITDADEALRFLERELKLTSDGYYRIYESISRSMDEDDVRVIFLTPDNTRAAIERGDVVAIRAGGLISQLVSVGPVISDKLELADDASSGQDNRLLLNTETSSPVRTALFESIGLSLGSSIAFMGLFVFPYIFLLNDIPVILSITILAIGLIFSNLLAYFPTFLWIVLHNAHLEKQEKKPRDLSEAHRLFFTSAIPATVGAILLIAFKTTLLTTITAFTAADLGIFFGWFFSIGLTYAVVFTIIHSALHILSNNNELFYNRINIAIQQLEQRRSKLNKSAPNRNSDTALDDLDHDDVRSFFYNYSTSDEVSQGQILVQALTFVTEERFFPLLEDLVASYENRSTEIEDIVLLIKIDQALEQGKKIGSLAFPSIQGLQERVEQILTRSLETQHTLPTQRQWIASLWSFSNENNKFYQYLQRYLDKYNPQLKLLFSRYRNQLDRLSKIKSKENDAIHWTRGPNEWDTQAIDQPNTIQERSIPGADIPSEVVPNQDKIIGDIRDNIYRLEDQILESLGHRFERSAGYEFLKKVKPTPLLKQLYRTIQSKGFGFIKRNPALTSIILLALLFSVILPLMGTNSSVMALSMFVYVPFKIPNTIPNEKDLSLDAATVDEMVNFIDAAQTGDVVGALKALTVRSLKETQSWETLLQQEGFQQLLSQKLADRNITWNEDLEGLLGGLLYGLQQRATDDNKLLSGPNANRERVLAFDADTTKKEVAAALVEAGIDLNKPIRILMNESEPQAWHTWIRDWQNRYDNVSILPYAATDGLIENGEIVGQSLKAYANRSISGLTWGQFILIHADGMNVNNAGLPLSEALQAIILPPVQKMNTGQILKILSLVKMAA